MRFRFGNDYTCFNIIDAYCFLNSWRENCSAATVRFYFFFGLGRIKVALSSQNYVCSNKFDGVAPLTQSRTIYLFIWVQCGEVFNKCQNKARLFSVAALR